MLNDQLVISSVAGPFREPREPVFSYDYSIQRATWAATHAVRVKIALAEELDYVKAKLLGTVTGSPGQQLMLNKLLSRKIGDQKVRVFRHIAANLDNDHVAKDPGVLKHLESKGRVFAITKAASYLLWWESFTTVRDYLVKNVDFMISDSTGLAPDVADGRLQAVHLRDVRRPVLG